MIKATFFKDLEGQYRAFSLLGHAGYADEGEDIVCAAVSVLSINTVNSIQAFTEDEVDTVVDEENGLLTCKFTGTVSEKSQLLIDSFLLGLRGVEEEYADQNYIKIFIKEV